MSTFNSFIRRYFFLLFLLIFSCVPLAEKNEDGKVVGVSDGDTIKILVNGKTVKVRLFEIDAPERSQAYGQKSRQFVSELVFGKQVRLISHGEDKYGRTLGVVIFESGKNLNEEIVKNGFAWKYNHSDNATLEKLEKQARKNKLGLWQENNPTPPWEYRKNQKTKNEKQPELIE